MKRLLSFYGILATILFLSCEPAATFDQPQPGGTKAITVFPLRIRGNYLSTDSISFLTISQNMIARIYDVDEGVLRVSLDSSYKLAGDTLYNLIDSSKEKIKLRGDTVVLHFHSVDTLFQISSDNVLKKFKGYYFLNKRYDDRSWQVQKMDLQNESLTIGSVSAKEDIDRLKEITESEKPRSDSVPIITAIHFKLSRNQFKKFVKQGGFANVEKFKRINYY